jgi:hypothetical protein
MAGVIERAYELALSGNHKSIAEIRSQLCREHHANVDSRLGGRLIKRQLVRLIQSAAKNREIASHPPSSTHAPDEAGVA